MKRYFDRCWHVYTGMREFRINWGLEIDGVAMVLGAAGVLLALASVVLPWPLLQTGVLVIGGVFCLAALVEILVATLQSLSGRARGNRAP